MFWLLAWCSAAGDEPPSAVGPIVAWGGNFSGQTKVPTDLEGVVAIAAGQSHSLALDRNGRVYAWGENFNRQCVVPTSLGQAVAIAGGANFSVALKADGRVSLWGSQTSVPSGLTNVVMIAAGGVHTLALTMDGKVMAWGFNEQGQTTVPFGLSNVVAIAAGGNHSLALTADGKVRAWGANEYGQGNVPEELENVVAIAAGYSHTLALRADGTMVAWGYNPDGRSQVPEGVTNIIQIAAGAGHNLALTSDGRVLSWGTYGQGAVPEGLSNVVSVAAGNSHSLALLGNGAPVFSPGVTHRPAAAGMRLNLYAPATGAWPISYQWQLNGVELMGETNAILRLGPLAGERAGRYTLQARNQHGTAFQDFQVHLVPMLVLQAPISQRGWPGSTVSFSMMTKGEGLTYQWSFNGLELSGQTHPSLVLPNTQWDQVGSYRVVVSDPEGHQIAAEAKLSLSPVVAWGANGADQVTVPAGLTNLTSIAADDNNSLALTRDGRVTVWGDNAFGQCVLPAGLTNVICADAGSFSTLTLQANGEVRTWSKYAYNRITPAGVRDVVVVAAGGAQNLALTKGGEVVAWRANAFDASPLPVKLGDAIAVSSRGLHSLALRQDGTVVAWGSDNYGEGKVPAGLSDLVAVAAGASHSLALKCDGTVVAWGSNSDGQVSVPEGLSNVVAIAAGGTLSLALKDDGTLIAWGGRAYGEVAVPPGLSNVVAIAAGSQHGLALVGDGPPVFAPGMTNRTAAVGSSLNLLVNPTGARPLLHQWKFNDADLPGQTNSILRLSSLQLANAGVYTAEVKNDYGTASQSFRVQVVPALIRSQPRGQRLAPGATLRLSVSATGQDLQYQWQRDGVDVSDATTPELIIANARQGHAGRYRVVVKSPVGEVLSDEASISFSSVLGWGSNQFGQCDAPPGLADVTAIAAGATHSIALRSDGSPVAWGDNTYGQTSIPTDATNLLAVACGARQTVALKGNGELMAWGDDRHGESQVPADLTNVVAVAAGVHHTLALTSEGNVRAFGWPAFGVTNGPSGLADVTAIAAGAYHNLALTREGFVVAWGSNGSGQTNTPRTLSNVVAIAAGAFHSLALKTDGTVTAWGSNTVGQVLVPAGLTNVLSIAAGGDQSLALTADGTVVVWGDSYYQQIPMPAPVAGAKGIAAGLHHWLAWFDPPPDDVAPAPSPPPTASSAASPVESENLGWNPLATGAQTVPPIPVSPGKRGKVFCAEHSTISYELYLPPDYSTNSPPLPVFITLNPNGGGMVSDFTGAAAELGIILVGIYEFQNGQALQNRIHIYSAVSRDLRLRLHYDPTALFVGGISGGGWGSYDFAKINRPFVAGLLPIVGWLGNQYGPTDRFASGLLVARATGATDPSAGYYLDPDGTHLRSYGVLIRDWSYLGAHEMPANSVRRECLAWLIDQRQPPRPRSKEQAESRILAWREAKAAGRGGVVLRECVEDILKKPRTYDAHYAQIMLDELEADYDGFRRFDLAEFTSGDDAQDLFFFGAFGAGRLAAKNEGVSVYYSCLKALTGIAGAGDIRHDDILWCLQKYGYPLSLQADVPTDATLQLRVSRTVPLLSDYEIWTTPQLTPAEWLRLKALPADLNSLEVPVDDQASRFFRLHAELEPAIGFPEDSTGPGSVSQ